MLGTETLQNICSNAIMVLLDVEAPGSLLDRPLVLTTNVEQRQLGFAAEGLATKGRGENRGATNCRTL
ncbi:hypothetical protein FV219_00830 [Methylobacterium sp. WL122]|nr:hypothetical protein FV219_00830 [Methylobacterium sp. WL122]